MMISLKYFSRVLQFKSNAVLPGSQHQHLNKVIVHSYESYGSTSLKPSKWPYLTAIDLIFELIRNFVHNMYRLVITAVQSWKIFRGVIV